MGACSHHTELRRMFVLCGVDFQVELLRQILVDGILTWGRDSCYFSSLVQNILIVCKAKSFWLTLPSDNSYLLSSYSFICVFICIVPICICMFAHVLAYMWKPEVNIRNLLLPLLPYSWRWHFSNSYLMASLASQVDLESSFLSYEEGIIGGPPHGADMSGNPNPGLYSTWPTL